LEVFCIIDGHIMVLRASIARATPIIVKYLGEIFFSLIAMLTATITRSGWHLRILGIDELKPQ